METEKLASLFKALGDTTRLKIIGLLNIREFCVCELVPILNISQPAVSKHLSRLKTAGFISEKRKGQWVFYSLNKEQLDAVGDYINTLPDYSSEIKQLEERGLLVNCE